MASIAGTLSDLPRQDAAVAPRHKPHFFGPVLDLLGLCGLSVLAIAAIALLRQTQAEPPPAMYTMMFIVAALINFPHFMHSYQIFYDDYREKIRAGAPLRMRYLLAGLVVPLALLALLAIAVFISSPRLLMLMATGFVFLTGWHYVKQGYGMLMADAVLKRAFFDTNEKRLLLINCYVVWAAYWCLYNTGLGASEVLGYPVAILHTPLFLALAMLSAAAILLAAIIVMLARKARNGGALPTMGIVTYLVTLYVWMFLLLDPWFLVIIPAFHSLQYLVVVWRLKLNAIAGEPATARHRKREIARFAAVGIGLGLFAFVIIPFMLDAKVHTALGGTLFVFSAWMFINIHHYFLDNVMWRRENVRVRELLFAR